MTVTIRFSSETVKELMARLRLAIRQLNRPLIQQISALLLLHDGLDVWSIGARVGVCSTTIYTWRDAFLVDRWASLTRGKSSGRPPKLKERQLKRLKELVIAGPEAAGYATGCWNAALVQKLIEREFGKTFHVNYISTLLKNLGFSYQKARFVSEHLDEVSRKRWRTRHWPAILRSARRQGALLLFADEASFAQWGSLGYTWALRGEQPVVLTTGKRKGYKVMGMVDYFSGRLFFEGGTGRLNATRYCAFLTSILAQTTQPIVVIHDGASYHTSALSVGLFGAVLGRPTPPELYRLSRLLGVSKPFLLQLKRAKKLSDRAEIRRPKPCALWRPTPTGSRFINCRATPPTTTRLSTSGAT